MFSSFDVFFFLGWDDERLSFKDGFNTGLGTEGSIYLARNVMVIVEMPGGGDVCVKTKDNRVVVCWWSVGRQCGSQCHKQKVHTPSLLLSSSSWREVHVQVGGNH